jgi:NAD(P)-dependent dehydrogenase (short-subunit alcohol dehydrogenase family)
MAAADQTAPFGPVLVTGTSSGIGRATAHRLARAVHLVYATARRPETISDLAAAGCRLLACDVTDEESMRAAVTAVQAEHGRVGTLVNNAGYGEYGPVEEVGLDRVRHQFETNVFGLARMCQLVLPGMRAAGRGRIVNVSSMGGRLTFPGGGYYHASKHAVEALSDALRFETRPFGVTVTVIEPGIIRTGFGEVASETLASATGALADGPYGHFQRVVQERMAHSYRNRFLAAGPEAVAAAIERAATTPRPRTRYVVTPAAHLLVRMRRYLPDRAFDAFLRQQFPV